MDHHSAINQIRWHSQVGLRTRARPQVSFVSPVMSVVLAAKSLVDREFALGTRLDSACMGYAKVAGLWEVLQGGYDPAGQVGVLHGQTYSRLARLSGHADVDSCNSTMVELLNSQLDGIAHQQFVDAAAKVIGELHDNVPSHARGVGFSAAQVYSRANERCLQFAVADCGQGMLASARKAKSSLARDTDAIQWCLKRGNTSAKPRDDWAQRLPTDCLISPFPQSVSTFSEDNHHVGDGLWLLTELIRCSEGSLWIWSGNGQYRVAAATAPEISELDVQWDGLAIEIEIYIDRFKAVSKSREHAEHLEQIARRIGL